MDKKQCREPKKITVKHKQPNGDIYVLERTVQYDPEKKFNKVLHTELIGKILKGETEMVPTRKKRPNGYKNAISKEEMIAESNNSGTVSIESEQVKASRKRVGMTDILEFAGEDSGIKDALYACTDKGVADKIMSLAWFTVCTNGQSFPGIKTWQLNHPMPYAEGISEDVYNALFEEIGGSESLMQMFFLKRAENLKQNSAIAYDSTTISTYSDNLIDARYGMNKAGDGRKTIKLLTLYSIDTGEPIAFAKQPGNLTDVVSLSNALEQLSFLGLDRIQLVTDNGFYSTENVAKMIDKGFNFLTLLRPSYKVVRDIIDNHRDEFALARNICPFDAMTKGLSVREKMTFEKKRKYANHKTGAAVGDVETFEKNVSIHVFFNPERRTREEYELGTKLTSLKEYIESGKNIDDLNDRYKKDIERFFDIKIRGKKITATINENSYANALKYCGYFALMSNNEKDRFEALRKYRKRNEIELFFEKGKQHTDLNHTRAWSDTSVMGRLFVHFVSLCYYEYLYQKISDMKATLGKENGNLKHDLKGNLDLEEKLKKRIEHEPLYILLQWFDAIEEVKVSSNIKRRRWNTEMTQLDKLFLTKLGMDV